MKNQQLADEALLRRLYLERLSSTEISNRLGCGQSSVVEALQRHGIGMRKRGAGSHAARIEFVDTRRRVCGCGDSGWPEDGDCIKCGRERK